MRLQRSSAKSIPGYRVVEANVMQVQSLDASMFACDLRPSSEKSLITEEGEPCFGRVVMGQSLAADRLPELTYQDFETSTGLEIVRANLLSSSPRRF